MRTMFKRNEELLFTVVAYGLLVIVALSFFTVRFTKDSYATLSPGPEVLNLYPSAVVPGTLERITVLSDLTNFGPETTVRSEVPGALCRNIRFTSDHEMTFEVLLREKPEGTEGMKIPFVISSPKGREIENLSVSLSITKEVEPLGLDLFSFQGEDTVATIYDFVLFGYRPKGYAPFHFQAKNLVTGKVLRQETRSEIDHLGAKLNPGQNPFELRLSDALGRETKKVVFVQYDAEDSPDLMTRLGLSNVCYAFPYSNYTGKPTQWSSDPTEQISASDCVLGNSPLGCSSGGCGSGGVRPPPNDYVTTLGEAPIGGDGVLLHNGQFREDVVDLYIPGRGLDFVWKRSYQSGNASSLNGFLGKGWDFSFGAHFIVTTISGVTKGIFSRGDGRRDYYQNVTYQGSSYVFQTHPAGYYDIKTEYSTSTNAVTQTKSNGFRQEFDLTTGILKNRKDRYGNLLSFSYNASGKLTKIIDTLSRNITIAYYTSGVGNGRIQTITDFANRVVTYAYAEYYPGGTVVLTKVSYPPTDWVNEAGTPQTNVSRTVQYTYDGLPGRLLTIVDGRGKTRIENVYDGNGRVDYQRNYSSGSVYHNFDWLVSNGNVTKADYYNRSGNRTNFYFDSASHLSTKVEVCFKPTDSQTEEIATTLITRGCTCTLPTAIQEPDNSYTEFEIDAYGRVTHKRRYADNVPSPYSTSAQDIRQKAYYAPITSSQFGVVTRIVGPMAFESGNTEVEYAIDIGYNTKGDPISITHRVTENPGDPYAEQSTYYETRTYNDLGQLLTRSGPAGSYQQLTYYGLYDTPTHNLGYLKEMYQAFSDGATHTTSYVHTNFGAPSSETKGSLVKNYTFDNEFLLKDVKIPYSSIIYTTNYTYNGNRQVVKDQVKNYIDVNWQSNQWIEKEFYYGNAGDLISKRNELTDSTWQSETFGYDADFRSTLRTDGRGKKIKYDLDARGLTTKVTYAYETPTPSADESSVKNFYDVTGKITKTVTAFRNNGDASDTLKVTRTTYDVFGRPEKIYDADSGTTPYSYTKNYYDLTSNITKVEEYSHPTTTDILLRKTQRYYDEKNRMWKSIRGTSGEDITTYLYDLENRMIETTDDNGNTTTMDYDLAGHLVTKHYPLLNGSGSGNNYETYEYELTTGNLTKRTSHEVKSVSPYTSSDYVWEMAYDELNRITTTTFKGSDGATGPNPVQTVNTYDSSGRVIRVTDADGVPTEDEYDLKGRKTKTTYNIGSTGPSPIVVTSAFDLSDNVTSRVDADSNSTTYAYDDQNRLTKTTHMDGDWISVSYNKLSLPMVQKYGYSTNTQKTLAFFYNNKSLLVSKSYSWTTTPSWYDYDNYKLTSETFTYDGAYRLINADNNNAKVTFEYNTLDQATKEKLNINYRYSGADHWKGDKETVSTWDDTGKRRFSVTYPISGKTFSYVYDVLDRATKISLNGATAKPMATYIYNGPSARVAQRDRGIDLNAGTPNTFRTIYAEDPIYRTTGITHQRITGSTTDIRKFDYTWGDGSSGRLYQQSQMNNSGYSNVTNAYQYDKLGRLTHHDQGTTDYDFTQTETQFWQSRDIDGDSDIYFWKAGDGSLQVPCWYPSARGFTYDDFGNMVTEQGVLSCYYDPLNRMAYIDGTSDYRFRYDALGRRVAEKKDGNESFFYYDGMHIVEETDSSLSLSRLSLFGIKIDEILYSGTVSGGSLANHRWPLTDILGTVHQVVDDSATTQTSFTYLAYGETIRTGNESYPYGFTGRRYLETEGIYDYRTRFYWPKLGRFLQRDSIGIWGDEANFGNGYAYVGNDSINKVDSTGKGPLCSSSFSIDDAYDYIQDDENNSDKAKERIESNAQKECANTCEDEYNDCGWYQYCTGTAIRNGGWSTQIEVNPSGKVYTKIIGLYVCQCKCKDRWFLKLFEPYAEHGWNPGQGVFPPYNPHPRLSNITQSISETKVFYQPKLRQGAVRENIVQHELGQNIALMNREDIGR